MRNFAWSFMAFFCFSATSFSQSNNDTGSYLSNDKGRTLKLNLLEDNKYEFLMSFGNSEVKFSGDYEIKGDSLQFPYKPEKKSFFNLVCKNDKKSKKIKISFIDLPDNPVFIGTQKGSEPIKYNDISNFQDQSEDGVNKKLVFEIDRVDYLYLICENPDRESKFSKFALPKDVSEIIINYEIDFFADSKTSGFFNRKSNRLTLDGSSKKDSIVFINVKNETIDSVVKVIPAENKLVLNWTYPGKEPLESEESVDSISASDFDRTYRFDFKLKISNNLKSAIAATKEVKDKFLVVVVDKEGLPKENFNNFIKNKEEKLSDSMYSKYDPSYDVFNYYLAGKDDNEWLKNHKITFNPCVLVLNGQGDILATAKSNIWDQDKELSYSEDFYRKLLRADNVLSVNKTLKNKTTTNVDLLKILNKTSSLSRYFSDAYMAVNEYESTTFVIKKASLDEKEVDKNWKKLIEAHQKDTKPNMHLVETISREINNEGFSSYIFNKTKVLNDVDFLGIDYLLKHYESIEENRLIFNNTDGENHNLEEVISSINKALKDNRYYISQDENSVKINNDKIISFYKKIIDSKKANFETYSNYFEYFTDEEIVDSSDVIFFKALEDYFDTILISQNLRPIEKLDELYSSSIYNSDSGSSLDSESEYYSDRWSSFKEYHSWLCNEAALRVVNKPQNIKYVKNAIKWSEYSVAINKDNVSYLTTLAQLYYKDGQKEKAIKTQQQVVERVKNLEDDTPIIANELLEKFKNGTY